MKNKKWQQEQSTQETSMGVVSAGRHYQPPSPAVGERPEVGALQEKRCTQGAAPRRDHRLIKKNFHL